MINEKEIRMLAAEIETLEATKESIDEQYKDAKERMFVAMNESPVVELNDLKV